MSRLDPAPDAIIEVTAELDEAKRRARAASIKAIAGMMAALHDALGDNSLRGMPNLVGSTRPYRGIRVRVKRANQLYAQLPRAPQGEWSEPALCINIRGVLVLARRHSNGDVSEEIVSERELFAEDAERIAHAISTLMRSHIDSSERGIIRFDRMRRFSEKLNAALIEGS